MKALPPFVHRFSRNGNIESICLTCLSTVCQCRRVEEVVKREAAHMCKDDDLSKPVDVSLRML
jgi:hypothetical protein